MKNDDLRAILYLTAVVALGSALGSIIARAVWWGVLSFALP